MDELVTKLAGFKSGFSVTGQTYPRKVDYNILAALGGMGASIHKVSANHLILMFILLFISLFVQRTNTFIDYVCFDTCRHHFVKSGYATNQWLILSVCSVFMIHDSGSSG